MTTLVASTPSPPPNIRTPPTPKHGYGDSWEPFSPRKSSRLSSQQASSAARTPSPRSSQPPSHLRHQLRSPRSTKRDYSDTTISPAPSPKKRNMPPMDANRRASGQLTAEGAAKAAASLGLPNNGESRQGRTNISGHGGMLPTPSKTPSRLHPSAENAANIEAIARNLFSHTEDEVVPSAKKKKAKKYIGLSMDSFTAIDDEEPIAIFTDSHERVPEVDNNVDNPFYGRGATAPAEPAKRRSKRRPVSIPGEGKASIEEASRRDDGLVYVFRGKKIFRKFEGEAAGQDEDQRDGGSAESPSAPRKRMTRSSIKPRLLFAPDHKGEDSADEHADPEEEVDTDIEDRAEDQDMKEPETPAELVDENPGTPKAPKFAPASPPITGRTTRSGNKTTDDLTPVKTTRGSKRSPFDGWRHTKSGSTASGHKRPGEELETALPAKRART